jgi:putative flippase GtrA
MKPSRNDLFYQIIKFSIIGVLNTALTLSVIFILTKKFNVYYIAANIAGYVIGVMNSFLWNKIWVFKSGNYYIWELGFFWLNVGICYLLQLGLVVLLKEELGINQDLAIVAGMFMYAGCNFLGNRIFVFRTRKLT